MTSVVIPAWNGRKFLEKNLPSVKKTGVDEIVIVDDASSDDTVDFLNKTYPEIILVRHEDNTRFPISVNDGFKKAQGDIVVLLNQDVSPSSKILTFCLPHFENPKMFAVTLNENNRSWAKAKFQNGFIEYTNGKLDDNVHTSFWASGGSAVFRKSMWEELGGFDSVFSPGYFEDQDIGFRAHKRGWEIVWEPRAVASHEAESSNKTAFASRYLTQIKERNYLLVHWKNLDLTNLLKHKFFLGKRLISTPGFVIPFLRALIKLPRVLVYRMKAKKFNKLTDEQVFAKFV